MIKCHGDNGAEMSISVNGGVSPYKYKISGGGSEITQLDDSVFISLNPGTYNIEVTDNSGCTTIGVATINEPPQIVLDSFVFVDDTTVKVYANGGSSDLIYAFDTVEYNQSSPPPQSIYSSNDTLLIDSAGGFAYIADSNGCWIKEKVTTNSLETEFRIFQIADCDNMKCPSEFNTDYDIGENQKMRVSDSMTCYNDSASLRVIVKDLTNTNELYNLSYEINGDTSIYFVNNTNNPQYHLDAESNLVPGFDIKNGFISSPLGSNHSIIVTDTVSGNTATYDFTVYSYDSIAVTGYRVDSANCFALNDDYEDKGAISIYKTRGGKKEFDFEWSGTSSNNDTIENLTWGPYNLTITDYWGCQNNFDFFINYKYNYEDSVYIGTSYDNQIDSFRICSSDEFELRGDNPWYMSGYWFKIPDSLSFTYGKTATFMPSDDHYPDNAINTYIYQVTDTNGCMDQDSISVYTNPDINIIEDQSYKNITILDDKAQIRTKVINLKDTSETKVADPDVLVSIFGNTDDAVFTWSSSLGISNYLTNPDSASPEIIGSNISKGDSVPLQLIAGSGEGRYPSDPSFDWFIPAEINQEVCSDTAQFNIVKWNGEIPDGFTPNGDGVNDTWRFDLAIESNGRSSVNVSIFNRWGQLLFSDSNYEGDWDGTRKGKELPVGTYYYIIEVKSSDGTQKYSGPLTIIR